MKHKKSSHWWAFFMQWIFCLKNGQKEVQYTQFQGYACRNLLFKIALTSLYDLIAEVIPTERA